MASLQNNPRLIEGLRVAVCAMLATMTIVVFAPGQMSEDSVQQLEAARSRVFYAHHPPIMSAVWRVVDRIIPGPLGMLVLQNAIFWSGVGLFCRIVATGWLSVLLPVLFVLPPLWGSLGAIWKDTLMGCAFLAAGSAAMAVQKGGGKGIMLAGLGMLFLGISVRYNAIMGAVPLAVLLMMKGRDWRNGIRRGLAASVLLYAASYAVTVQLVPDSSTAFMGHSQYMRLFDLAGISVRTGVSVFPAVVMRRPEFTLDRVRNAYNPASGDVLVWDWLNFHPEMDREIREAWWKALREHPREYLSHRGDFLAELMRWERPGAYGPYQWGIFTNKWGYANPEPPRLVSRLAIKYMDMGVKMRLYKPWIWFAGAFLVFGWAILSGRMAIEPACFVASGILYFLPYPVIGPTAEFRYMWWILLSFILAGTCIILPQKPRPIGIGITESPKKGPNNVRGS